MGMRSFATAVALLGLCGGLSPVAAQKGKPAQVRPRAPNRQNRPPKPAQNPAQELERFEKMSPKDRQKALEKLPPARRARMEQQLSRYESLTPAQRDQVNRRLKTYQSLSPPRQNAVRQELQHLRSLPPPDRAAILNGDEQSRRFSSKEVQLMRESLGQPNMF
jgi:hypothetical protein